MDVLGQAHQKLFTAATLARAGFVRPERPDRLLRTGITLLRWGPTPAAGYISSAARFPDEVGLIDELGTLTFSELDRRSNGLAHAFADKGIGEGDNVAILCRNHRYFIDTTVALSKLGANALYLNTQFAGPQVTEVCEREDPVALVYDEEFHEMVDDAAQGRERFVAWADDPEQHEAPVLENLIDGGDPSSVVPPKETGKVTILTSGTTGTPKGANRESPTSLDPVAAFLDKIPLRARRHHHIAAPMFHSWGFLHFLMGLGLSSTLVLRRKFDPEQCLSTTAQFDCDVLAVVPVMLQRILELPEETIRKYDLRKLRVIAASGSALPGDLANRVMDLFGDVLYNLYGSTEVAWATIATPKDLREAPGTSGKAPFGTIVKIYDDDGQELPQGETGRIFVGNEIQFEGYTGGGGKDVIDGLLSSGDVGHFDENGRLFIDGRDDEMIVSGGENVFPREVEDLLANHEAIEDAAVVGVDDEDFGQRLAAFVVLRDGKKLSEQDVKDHVKSNLAKYKVPREVTFLDELPRNATGKVLKRELAEHGEDAEGEEQDGSDGAGEDGSERREEAEAEG